MTPYRLFIGWDAHQMEACAVAQASAARLSTVTLDIRRLALSELIARGLYTRPMRWPSVREAGYWDVISAAPMATSHAIARFLVPYLCDYQGWALFTDGDVLFRHDVGDLFWLADPTQAVQVVQHTYTPQEAAKMEGQIQTRYPRKNWSSVMLFNCAHPANRSLDLDVVNRVPGRDLHRFCWLEDSLVGALPARWNWLVGASEPEPDPAIVHFTAGVPNMPGYEHVAYADEWYALAHACGYRLTRPARPEAVA